MHGDRAVLVYEGGRDTITSITCFHLLVAFGARSTYENIIDIENLNVHKYYRSKRGIVVIKRFPVSFFFFFLVLNAQKCSKRLLAVLDPCGVTSVHNSVNIVSR